MTTFLLPCSSHKFVPSALPRTYFYTQRSLQIIPQIWLSLMSFCFVEIPYRNLLYLKNYEGDADDLSLNFTVINDDYGEVQVSEIFLIWEKYR